MNATEIPNLCRLWWQCDCKCEFRPVSPSLSVYAIPALRCNCLLSARFHSFSVRCFVRIHPLLGPLCMALLRLVFDLNILSLQQSQPYRLATVVGQSMNQRNRLLCPFVSNPGQAKKDKKKQSEKQTNRFRDNIKLNGLWTCSLTKAFIEIPIGCEVVERIDIYRSIEPSSLQITYDFMICDEQTK